ncbi:hypothetical protein GCM10011514_34900 [Emticicia aquatilis]|uniref:DUF748 domain-containing protein n=1 Tax=Emticicia aquatilis TaxID=1537369 RepID=A0A916YYY9_9BACT|nr:hypothetical protein [Emticicia aquatilis]GGD67817.1 hypothetical protein GCM10011514_34900 [Emticicia aquatilis]
MKPVNTARKILLRVLYGFIFFSIVVTLIGIWGLKPLLSSRIKEAILTSTNGLYQIDFKGIQYSPMTGNAEIRAVTWMADSMLFDKLRNEEKLPNNVFKCEIEKIKLTGLKPWTIIFSKKLNISTISVENPFIEILHEKHAYNNSNKAKTPYQAISRFVESFSVDKINLENISLTYTNLSKSKRTKSSRIASLDLEVSNLLIDSLSHKDTARFYYSKECIVRLKKLEFPSADSLNTFRLNTLEFSSENRTLTIQKLALEPHYKPFEYGNRSNGNDRVEVLCEAIKVSNIDLEKLLDEKKIYAKELSIDKGRLNVFSDERPFIRPAKINYRLYPHQAFAQLNLKFNIQKISLQQINITFSQYNPETRLTGYLYFNNIKGKLLNVTNDTLPLQQNPICEAYLSTRFMKKNPVNLTFNFNLKDPKGAFRCKGEVSPMPLSDLNQVTNALAKAKVDSGILDSFSFNLQGDKYGLRGPVTFLYHDLKVSLMKEQEKTKVMKIKKLLSFFANKSVLKSSNPIRNKPVKTVAVNFQRNPKKGFFTTFWQALLEGIRGTVM